jgi:threonine dehydratase
MATAQNAQSARKRIPTFSEIEQAAARLRPIVVPAPLFESDRLNQLVGGRLLIKAESLQPTGSFKVRGAWNHLSRMTSAERAGGVLALSAGNHAQAVAWAARKLDAPRTVILMPHDAAALKVERTRALGAEVVFYDPHTVDYYALISGWIEREGMDFVHPFDDPDVIAGAGTVAMEVVQAAEAAGGRIDEFVAACSGGGLIAGSALALEALSPGTRLWGAEPTAFDDTARSLAAGQRVAVPASGQTICDTLASPTPGQLTFEINQSRLAGALSGDDAVAKRGMMTALAEFGLVAEPSGALALGIVLENRRLTEGRTVAVVISGRNVDPASYVALLQDFQS